jgi:hypothetical protein
MQAISCPLRICSRPVSTAIARVRRNRVHCGGPIRRSPVRRDNPPPAYSASPGIF